MNRYALGAGDPESFSWWLEFHTQMLGRIGGGNAMKHLIFKQTNGDWYFPDEFPNESLAWESIRGQLIQAFRLAAADDFAGISALPQLQNGSLPVAKAIYGYNPDRLLPVFSKGHREHFMRLLGSTEDVESGATTARIQALGIDIPDALNAVAAGRVHEIPAIATVIAGG